MAAVGNTLLLFGGKMKNGSLSNQLWQYNISGEKFASALSTVSVFRIRLYNISGEKFGSALSTVSVFRICLFQKHILFRIGT
jgi:hypothetical protein